MKSSRRVLCIGAVLVDIVCSMPAFPLPGEGVVATDVVKTLGGCAFNNARTISQLGGSCFLMAPVGNGMYADFVRKGLKDAGLEALEVGGQIDSGACVCIVEPSGERTMLTMPGIDRRYQDVWFDSIDANDFACAIVGGYEIEGQGGDSIVSFLESHPQLPFYYAPGPRILGVGSEKTERINALRPVWHLNDQEALAFAGVGSIEEAGLHIARGCNNVAIITAGAEGCYVFDGVGGSILHVSTKAIRPLDTVGAGDAHVGALAAARSAGYSWEEAARLANEVSGAVCGVPGATMSDEEFERAGLPRL